MGHSLVKGDLREQRIKAWFKFANSHNNTDLYCWRGGMRSNYAYQWMKEEGVEIQKIDGGFKELRRVLIDEIDDAIKDATKHGIQILDGEALNSIAASIKKDPEQTIIH